MKVFVFGAGQKSEVVNIENSEDAILQLLGGKGVGRVFPSVGQDMKFFAKSADLLENGAGPDDMIVAAALTESGEGFQSVKTWQAGRALRVVRALYRKKAEPAPAAAKRKTKRSVKDDTAK